MIDSSSVSSGPAKGALREIRVWDPLVRIGHWTLVALFAVAYLTEGEPEVVHTWAGYGIAAYLVIRLIWGFVGPQRARFSDFAYGPRAALGYLRELIRGDAKRHIGHSPAGAVMVFALLVGLTATVVSGMALLAVKENEGPLAPWLGSGVVAAYASEDDDRDGDKASDEAEDLVEEVHEVFSNLTLLLVLGHIGGVAVASFAHRENLVRAMITGRKRAE